MPGTNSIHLSERELKLIMNNCYSNIFVTDGEGKIVFANKDAAEALCVSEEYLLGSLLLPMRIYFLNSKNYFRSP
jgi:PAS domain-containing protein